MRIVAHPSGTLIARHKTVQPQLQRQHFVTPPDPENDWSQV